MIPFSLYLELKEDRTIRVYEKNFAITLQLIEASKYRETQTVQAFIATDKNRSLETSRQDKTKWNCGIS